jgi:small subunit ribosomal protein S21
LDAREKRDCLNFQSGLAFAVPFFVVLLKKRRMIEVNLNEGDRIDWALKTFKKKVLRSGILKDLRQRRHYIKPSEARQIKAAAAKRRARPRPPRP